MKLDFAALHEDAVSARVKLYMAHCEQADEPAKAILALYTVLRVEAMTVLEALYGGDRQSALEHDRRISESQ